MQHSSKKKAHRGCSCRQCMYGRSTKAGQAVQRANEKKLRQMTKRELRLAVREMIRELEIIDILGKINSPYTD